MDDFLETVVRGTRRVFRDPKLAAALYVAALAGVIVSVTVNPED